MSLFQVFSRNNDTNGNPYRLLLVYNQNGQIIEAYEARDSIPNIESQLRKLHWQLPSFHLNPKEYNLTKKSLPVNLTPTN